MTDMFLIAVASILQMFILGVNGDLPFTSKAHNPYTGGGIEITFHSEKKREDEYVPWLPCPGRCFSNYRSKHTYEGGNPVSERTFEMCNDDAGRHAWERALENCCEECAADDDGRVVDSKKCTNYALTQIAALGNNCNRYHCKIFNSSANNVFKNDAMHYGGTMVDEKGADDANKIWYSAIDLPEGSLHDSTSWEYKFGHEAADKYYVNQAILGKVYVWRLYLTGDGVKNPQCEIPEKSPAHGCYGFLRGYRPDFGNGWFKIKLAFEHLSNPKHEEIHYKQLLLITGCSKDSFYAKAYSPFNETTNQTTRVFNVWFHVKAGLPVPFNSLYLPNGTYSPGYTIPRRNAYQQTVLLNDDWKKPALTVTYHETDSLEATFKFSHHTPDSKLGDRKITMRARLERNLLLWNDFEFVYGYTETTSWSTEAMDDFRIAVNFTMMPKALYHNDFLAKLFADDAFKSALAARSEPRNLGLEPVTWILSILQAENLRAEHRVAFMKLAEDNSGFNGLPAKLEKMNTDKFKGHARLTWDPEANAEGANKKSVMLYEMYLYYIMPFGLDEAKPLVDAIKAVFQSLIS